MSVQRKFDIEELKQISPLEVGAKLQRYEFYDMRSTRKVLDEIYEKFDNEEDLKKALVRPIFCSMIDGLLSVQPFKSTREQLNKKGLTVDRLVNECEDFSYNQEEFSDCLQDEMYRPKTMNNEKCNDDIAYGKEYSDYKDGHFRDQKKMDNYRQQKFGNNKTTTDEYDLKKKIYNKRSDALKRNFKQTTQYTSDLDHIIPCKKVYDNLSKSFALSDQEIKKIINIDDNFAMTNSTLNRSKGDMTNKQYVDSEKGKNLSDDVKKQMIKKENEAKFALTKETSKIVGTKSMNDTISQAKNQFFGEVLLIAIKPLYYEVKNILIHGMCEGVNASSVFEALSIRFGRLKQYLLNTIKNLSMSDLFKALKEFINIFIESIINLMVGMVKTIAQIIKEGFKIFVQAIKVLKSNDMTSSQKGDAITKLVAAGLSGFIGIAIEWILNKLPVLNAFSKPISIVLTGIATSLFMYLLDKIDLFSVKAEMRYQRVKEIFEQRIHEIEKATYKFDKEVTNLLIEQRQCFENLTESLNKSLDENDMSTFNETMNDVAKFFKIDLPYQTTEEFVNYFDSLDTLKI